MVICDCLGNCPCKYNFFQIFINHLTTKKIQETKHFKNLAPSKLIKIFLHIHLFLQFCFTDGQRYIFSNETKN